MSYLIFYSVINASISDREVNRLTDSVDCAVDGFHGDVIRLQSQKSEVLRIVIYTRLKINRK